MLRMFERVFYLRHSLLWQMIRIYTLWHQFTRPVNLLPIKVSLNDSL